MTYSDNKNKYFSDTCKLVTKNMKVWSPHFYQKFFNLIENN